jgi:hypothetical protein
MINHNKSAYCPIRSAHCHDRNHLGRWGLESLLDGKEWIELDHRMNTEMNNSYSHQLVVSTVKIFEVLTGTKRYTLFTTIDSLTLFFDGSSISRI